MRRIIYFLVIAITVCCVAEPCLARGSSSLLLPVRQNHKWGFINRQGKMVIEPRYERAEDFREGLAAVMVDEKWTFIDQTGKLVRAGKNSRIVVGAEESSRFSEGLKPIAIKGKCGCIDRSGRVVIKPRYEQIESFKNGYTRVRLGGLWGFIDRRGNVIAKPQFSGVCDFSEGLAAVRVGNEGTGKWGFIDTRGRMVIQPRFYDILSPSDIGFHEGLAAVQLTIERGNKLGTPYGYIDKRGKIVIPAQFGMADDFHDGIACVWLDAAIRFTSTDGSLYDVRSYIDKTGKFIWKAKATD